VQPTRYMIVVRGTLRERFATAFPGVTIELGEGLTRLLTEPFDQGQLEGLLDQLWSFGLELISITQGETGSG
jgi:hypothetical protein